MKKREFFKMLPGFSIIPCIDISTILHARITYKESEFRLEGRRIEITTNDNGFYTVYSKEKGVDKWDSILNGQPIKLISLKYGWVGDDDIRNYGNYGRLRHLRTGEEIRNYFENKLYYVDISYKKLPN